MTDEFWFERLASQTEETTPERASARLKSRVYSAVVMRMAESRPLLDLKTAKQRGEHLCVFESALTIVPVGTDIRSMNPCRMCHARVLGERMENAPIFWPGCPYSDFHGS